MCECLHNLDGSDHKYDQDIQQTSLGPPTCLSGETGPPLAQGREFAVYSAQEKGAAAVALAELYKLHQYERLKCQLLSHSQAWCHTDPFGLSQACQRS